MVFFISSGEIILLKVTKMKSKKKDLLAVSSVPLVMTSGNPMLIPVLPLIRDMFNNDKDITSGLGLIETSNTDGKMLSPIQL